MITIYIYTFTESSILYTTGPEITTLNEKKKMKGYQSKIMVLWQMVSLVSLVLYINESLRSLLPLMLVNCYCYKEGERNQKTKCYVNTKKIFIRLMSSREYSCHLKSQSSSDSYDKAKFAELQIG